MNKPKVGDTLYSLNVGYRNREQEQELVPVVVTKVGRKYFTCKEKEDDWRETQYYIDSWLEKTDYTRKTVLYADPQDWEDYKESRRISTCLREIFAGYSNKTLTLKQLKAIEKIVMEEEP